MKKRNKYTLLLIAFLCLLYYLYPYKIEAIGYYHKIWAHRVNSIEKLNSAVNYFEGIELDLVYNSDKNYFDVNHPPTKSINLHFEEYLNNLEKEKFPYLWLDIKNIKKENAKTILVKLVTFFKAKRYPLNKVLIESKNAKELPIFEKSGFKTIYYLPYELHKKDSLTLAKEILKIKKVILQQPNIAISSSFKDYNILKKEFPKHPKYIWALVKPIHFNHLKIRKILKDESVKIVLLNYHSFRGNR